MLFILFPPWKQHTQPWTDHEIVLGYIPRYISTVDHDSWLFEQHFVNIPTNYATKHNVYNYKLLVYACLL